MSKAKLMIVEDEWAIAEDLKQSLQILGYEVTSVEETGEGAIRRAKEDRPDLVLMDIMLKEKMNGIDAAGQIKSRFNIPHIFMTANANKEILDKAKLTEAFGYIVKPWNDHELQASIEMALYKHSIEKEMHYKQVELSALYNVSSAISRTLDMQELLKTILVTLTDIEVLNVQRKAGIFIIEDDRMKLVAHLGHSEEFLNLHNNMRVGDCLCGLAAQTREIIITRNSFNNSRHTIQYPGMEPHGHIIIPLQSGDRMIGVLYLYIPVDVFIDERVLKLINSISLLLGVAVENARLYEETKKFSLHDPLTGLANRRHMEIVIERNFARARRHKEHFSLVMLDIDHFKKYNDRHGHMVGDKLLINIASIILMETREIDLVVRYGGEEFLILLPETEQAAAREVAERIRKSVEEETSVTISIGISSFQKGIVNEDELIERADKALYKAKEKGRNCIVESDRRMTG